LLIKEKLSIDMVDLFPSFHFGHHTSKEVHGYTQKKIIVQNGELLKQNSLFVLKGGGTAFLEQASAFSGK